MAVVTPDQVVRSGNFPLPPTRVTNRCMKASFKKSNSGNPMTVLECEVVCGPNGEQVVEVGKDKCKIAGMKLTYWLPYTDGMMANIFDLNEKLFGTREAIDTDNPDTKQYEGLCFDAIISIEQTPKMTKTAAGEYVPILDAKGQKVMQFQTKAQITDILGLSDVQVPTGGM